MFKLDNKEFILACSYCGQRLVLENEIEYDQIIEKYNIVISDLKEILIMCNKCGNRVKF